MDSVPAIIRALSDAGVSGWMFMVWGILMIVGFGWGGASLKGLKENLKDSVTERARKLPGN